MARPKKAEKKEIEIIVGEGYHYGAGMVVPRQITQDGVLAYFINNATGARTLEFYDHDELKGLVQ